MSSTALAKLNLKIIQLNAWVADNITTTDLLFLSNILSLTGTKITQPLCLLFSFLCNRLSCMHNDWVANNHTPLEMLFYPCIVAEYNTPKKSKITP